MRRVQKHQQFNKQDQRISSTQSKYQTTELNTITPGQLLLTNSKMYEGTEQRREHISTITQKIYCSENTNTKIQRTEYFS